MICHRDFPDHVAAAREAVPGIRFVLSIGPSGFGDEYDALVDRHAGTPFDAVSVEHDDPCWFFFTSGTTGRPKAAVLTHGQLGFVVTNHLCDLMPGMTAADASLVVAPLSHGAGVHQLAQVARGVKTILPARERMDVDEVWSLVQEWRVTNMFTVPTIVKMLTEHPAVDRIRPLVAAHRDLRRGADVPRGPEARAAQARPRAGAVFRAGRGDRQHHRPAARPARRGGRPRRACRHLRLRAHRRCRCRSRMRPAHEVAAGETGEICVCGLAVFAGYYNNPDANAKAFRDGWFRTGDLGHMDAQGFLFITGRASDMYISGGSNVYPREIEEKMLTHPAIAEVAILGVPDRTWGEVGVAVCVLRAGASGGGGRRCWRGWRTRCRATSCRSRCSSGTSCRRAATARSPRRSCGRNSRPAAISGRSRTTIDGVARMLLQPMRNRDGLERALRTSDDDAVTSTHNRAAA